MSGNLGFGRLQAILGQMTQVLTVTAANFNFDFTLVKVEASPKYRDMATVLSPAHVREAEIGPVHTTARKLEYGGIDATSIWAAATSSKAALPVNLLAYIIARTWLPAEATSLWTEVIAERKHEILTGVEQGDWLHPGISYAVQQEITREQLAKWDSSTRAWLQSADISVRQSEYKQFLLIAQNGNVAIHN
ncbi:hypothetical protein GGS24DRAFT_498650 [Hypoxylon argillaceum]|nr:hypothetical protein GGS24DRAFT_498650 [Hypoxylon argillaceum]